MSHLDDDAELYALRMTDGARDAEIEQHLATCATCRARVVAAESVAASLAAALPPAPPRMVRRASWATWGAAAAAVLFAATTALEATSARTASQQVARTEVALNAIAASHFGHTTLTSAPGVTAKALYARDGAWCYVIVDGAPRDAHVVLHRGGVTSDAGTLQGGAPATLYIGGAGKADAVDVVAGGATIAHGTPAY